MAKSTFPRECSVCVRCASKPSECVANLRSLVIELKILIACGFVTFCVLLHPSPGRSPFGARYFRFVRLDSIQDKNYNNVCRIMCGIAHY